MDTVREGEYVSFMLTGGGSWESDPEPKESCSIHGYVRQVDVPEGSDRPDAAMVEEGYATSIWGGSKAAVGTMHSVRVEDLKPGVKGYRRIVDMYLLKHHAETQTATMVD